MSENIVRRLRQMALPDPYDERPVMNADFFTSAADHTEQREVENNDLKQMLEDYKDSIGTLEDDNERLEAENARLRKSEELLKELVNTKGHDDSAWIQNLGYKLDEAKAHLDTAQPPKESAGEDE